MPTSAEKSAKPSPELYKLRRDRIRSTCDQLRLGDGRRDVAENPSQFLIVDEEHKLIYCNVPKVGCTSWKRVFLSLAGFDVKRNKSLNRVGISKSGRQLLNYVHKYDNILQRRHILKDYSKFLVVRDPFTRLLSAYQNKLSPRSRQGTTEKSDYYTKFALMIVRQLYGEAEMKRVRNDMSLYNLTFAEFVHFLVHPETKVFDRHWERIHELCLPCDIEYDFVGKYETLTEDAEFILKSAGIDMPFPTAGKIATHSSVQNTVSEYYKTVSPRDLRTLFYDKFYLDFKLFDYSPMTFAPSDVFPDGVA